MEVNQQNPQDNLKNKKKLWIIWGVLTGLAVLALIIVVILMNISPQPTTSRKKAPDSFSLLPGKEPIMYAGNQVYDACNLISFDTVRTHIKNYQTLLDSIKTNQRPVQPLVIEHNYIDRNISTILGNDGQARAKGTIIGATDEGISQFTSLSDSSCWYGQGEGLSRGKGTTFVKT